MGRVSRGKAIRVRPLNSIVIPLQDNVDRVESIYSAFAQAERPDVGSITDHPCPECEEIRDLLHPFAAREVPDVESYPLYSALPLLTAKAYRYYLPRYIAQAVQTPNSLAAEMLLYSLGRVDDERIASFSPRERAAVIDFVGFLETLPTVGDDRHYLETARKQWK